jgi:hypothetical protein
MFAHAATLINHFGFELAGRKQSEAIFPFADVSILYKIFPNALLKRQNRIALSLLCQLKRKALYVRYVT